MPRYEVNVNIEYENGQSEERTYVIKAKSPKKAAKKASALYSSTMRKVPNWSSALVEGRVLKAGNVYEVR